MSEDDTVTPYMGPQTSQTSQTSQNAFSAILIVTVFLRLIGLTFGENIMQTDSDLERFERIVRAATSGKRSVEAVNRDGPDEGYIITAAGGVCIGNYVERPEDALLIEACTPEFLLELIDKARTQDREIAERVRERCAKECDKAVSKIDADGNGQGYYSYADRQSTHPRQGNRRARAVRQGM